MCHFGVLGLGKFVSIRVPSHLYRNRHGGFYFRYVVPQTLRSTAGVAEIRFSLRTELRQTAIITALLLIADLPRLGVCLQRMADDGESAPKDFFKLWRDELFKGTTLRAKIKLLEGAVECLEERMTDMVPRERAKMVAKLWHDKGQLQGKKELEENLVFPWAPDRTALFSELLAAYLKSFSYRAEGGRKRPVGAKTLDGYGKDIGFLIKVLGDVPIGSIDREVAGEYFNVLRQLPANLTKKREYRDLSISELLALKAPPQSEYNSSKKMERPSGMFKWALLDKRKWGIDTNPFEGYGQSGENASKRRPFTIEELKLLLLHPSYAKRQFESAYSFWLIPLALFTGARLGELAQLDLKDFVIVEGINCVDINDIEAVEDVPVEGNRKKRVKTKNAKRLVPIHPELVRLGLLRYVVSKREQGQVYFFPELSRARRDGPSHAASNWFRRFRNRAGITIKQEAVFHSFRHGFITTLLDAGVTPHLVAPIVGHEAELITGKVYWNKQDASKRKPTIDSFTLTAEVLALFPSIEDVTFVAPRGRQVGTKK